MAKASKPVELMNKHLTKEEIKNRKDAEEKLKGKKDLVYKVPKNLSKEGKKIYKFLVNELKEVDILTNIDLEILVTTVDAMLRMTECRENINQNGVVVFNDEGTMFRNPATIIYKDYVAIYNKCCMEIGLSPSARAKLAQLNINAGQKEEDPLLKALSDDDD